MFVDADNCSNSIPSLLADPTTKLFTIFVSFPRKARWAPLKQTTDSVVVFMRTWTEEEIVQA